MKRKTRRVEPATGEKDAVECGEEGDLEDDDGEKEGSKQMGGVGSGASGTKADGWRPCLAERNRRENGFKSR